MSQVMRPAQRQRRAWHPWLFLGVTVVALVVLFTPGGFWVLGLLALLLPASSLPADAIPAFPERGRIETLSGSECPIGAFRGLAAEDPSEDPFAREPDEVKPVVGRTGLTLRMEVEVERHFLDERWIGRRARSLLEPVRHQRGEHLDLTDAGTDGDSDRDRGRADDHPRQLDEMRPTGESPEDWNSEDDHPLDVFRTRLGLLVAR